jgi:hypothetical protein
MNHPRRPRTWLAIAAITTGALAKIAHRAACNICPCGGCKP